MTCSMRRGSLASDGAEGDSDTKGACLRLACPILDLLVSTFGEPKSIVSLA